MAPSIKSVLVTAYFNFMEIMQGIEGMFPNPAARISLPDYEGYWLSRETGSWQPRFQIVADSIQRAESVLDIGCGDGVLLEHLTKARQATGIGLDISKIAVHRARLRNLDVRCQTLNEFREQNQCLRFHH